MHSQKFRGDRVISVHPSGGSSLSRAGPLLLISSCAVVERTATWCGGKFKTPVVKQESFELKLDFSQTIGKGHKWTILLCVGGENRPVDSNENDSFTAPSSLVLQKH